MADRWAALKDAFRDGGDVPSSAQRRALRPGLDARTPWRPPRVGTAPGDHPAAQLRAEGTSSAMDSTGGEPWIVTAGDSRFWHFLTCFVASLRDVARYTGRLAIIDYGLTPDQRERLREHAVVLLAPRGRHQLVVDRYLTLAGHLPDDPEAIVLYFDADIWFTDSLADLLANPGLRAGKLGAAKDVWQCDYYFRCTPRYHHATVRAALADVVRDYGQTLQAGFIAGSGRAWVRYTALLGALLAEEFARPTWGADALALNLYAELYADHFELLPITYNAPPLWGVVREGTRFFATKLDTDGLHRPSDARIPVRAIHWTGAVRERSDLRLGFGDVYPDLLADWTQRLGAPIP